MELNECGVYVGNLRSDIRISEMKDNLCDMVLSTGLGIPIQRNHINVVHKPYTTYAFILVRSSSDAQGLINALSVLSQQHHVIVNNVTAAGRVFKVAPMYEKRKQLPRKAAVDSIDNLRPGRVADNTDDLPPGRLPRLEPIQANNTALLIPMESIKPINRDLLELYKPDSKSDSHLIKKISQAGSKFPMHKMFYQRGELLGAETRFVEFKQGRGQYLQRQLKDHVAKYTCGFLNSEGGTLLIGVSDNGRFKPNKSQIYRLLSNSSL